MTDQHPITAPPGLAAEWVAEIYGDPVIPLSPITLKLVDRSAQWGYDQRGEVNDAELRQARDEELEACCEWLRANGLFDTRIQHLRAARRPKPPSLKEQALAEVGAFEGMGTCNIDILRRALEALPDD